MITTTPAAPPVLPPSFAQIPPGPAGPFRTALAAAASGAEGGTLVAETGPEHFELAVIFEPDRALERAWPAALAVMLAAGDSLAAIGPPQVPVGFVWPDRIEVNGALVGGVRVAAPDGAAPDEPPAWLVAGLGLRLCYPADFDAPGLVADQTALREEGFDEVDVNRLIESIARNLLYWVDRWVEEGTATVAEHWGRRVSPDAASDGMSLDPETGDLLHPDPQHRARLAEALLRPTWSLAPLPGGRA